MRQSLLMSFKNAFHGLRKSIKEERNLQIHFLVSFFVLSIAIILQIKIWEFIIVFMFCLLVIVLELLNTIVEKLLDFFKPQLHSYVKEIKDVLAGLVLLVAISAVIVGSIIFIPYLYKLFLS